ncbi:hypothetical protein, partial [Aetokthonos hydrillicola]|uniref:hypothetical protein n=1 Tax=Aetokthonos hydrillicola TaxID=1550245 RepID=UPI001FB9FC2F
MSPKSEFMIYLGVAPGGYGSRFMRSPNNTVFTSSQALFDEKLFPKGPESTKRQHTRLHKAPEPPHEAQNDPQGPPFPPSQDDDDDDFYHQPPPPPTKKGPGAQLHDQRARSQSPPLPPRDEQPEAGPSDPRRSGRTRNVPTRPGNVYGESRHPT